MIAAAPAEEEVAAWLICDHAFQRRYPFGMSKPFPVPVWPYVRSGYLKRGATLEELARTCGIDPAGLADTVAAFNRHAVVGEDPEFGRGRTAFNRGSGDPEHGPNPSLAPIEKGPFYAIKVLPGSFGTFAGLKTDASSRVLTADGRARPRPVRRGQRPGQRDGRALPVRRHQHRPGHDLRLHRRPARRRRHRATRTSSPCR